MIKFVKKLSYVICGLLIYSFIGGLTYSVHEHFYPGNDIRWANPHKARGNASTGIGVIWPISLPAWGGVEAIKWAISDVLTPIINVGKSAGEDLLNE